MKARAVKRAAKKAEQLHAQMYGSDADEILDSLSSDGDDNPAEPGNPDSDTPAEPVAVAEPVIVPDAEEPPPEPVMVEEPTAESTIPDVVPDATELLEKAEHKYSVLQGMHRKMLEENNELRGRVMDLESQLNSVTPPAASPVESESLITDTDVDDYGSDLIEMVKRAAQQSVSPELNKLREENEALRNQISGVTTTISTRAKEDIYSTLATQVPNWEEINQSEDYLFWLAQRDPFSGERRHDLLTQAFTDNNSARVVTFFKAFLNEDMTVTPSEPAATAPVAPVPPKIDLVSMAAPGRAQSAGAPSNQEETRVYSRAEISAHYKAVQTGKFVGTDAEKTRIEKAFIKAANEGRVT